MNHNPTLSTIVCIIVGLVVWCSIASAYVLYKLWSIL